MSVLRYALLVLDYTGTAVAGVTQPQSQAVIRFSFSFLGVSCESDREGNVNTASDDDDDSVGRCSVGGW